MDRIYQLLSPQVVGVSLKWSMTDGYPCQEGHAAEHKEMNDPLWYDHHYPHVPARISNRIDWAQQQ